MTEEPLEADDVNEVADSAELNEVATGKDYFGLFLNHAKLKSGFQNFHQYYRQRE